MLIINSHNLIVINKKIGNSEKIIDNNNFFSIHRLDNEIEGTLLCAKNLFDKEKHKELIKKRMVTKIYIGEIFGSVNDEVIRIETRILHNKTKIKSYISSSGKIAVTYAYKLEEKNIHNIVITKMAFFIITGRTHQIRLHMQYIKKPIIRDSIYGIKDKQYLYISSQYSNIALRSLAYIFHTQNMNIGYMC